MATTLNINQFNDKVKSLLTALPAEVQKINDGLAISAIPLIVNRLTDLGEDGTGKKLGQYSNQPLPTFFYLHKGLGSGADAKLESLVKQKQKAQKGNFKGISYAEFRQINNRPINFVTLSFTGETLGDLGVTKNIVNGLVIVTTVGEKNTISKKKYNAKGEPIGEITTGQVLEYLSLRYGQNILALTQEEQKQIANAYNLELQKLFNKYLA